MSDTLTVWLHGQEIGSLQRRRRGASFRYSDDLIDSSRDLPLLSVALPVRPESFDARQTANWFTGLLPEDQQLLEAMRRFRLVEGDYLSLLAEIGWECAGAVLTLPARMQHRTGSLQPLDNEELAERLKALPARPFDPEAALRVSMGGFQAKMLVTLTDDGWALPLEGAMSTHILKPQPQTQWPGLVESEAWAMTAAAKVTPTAAVRLLRIGDAPVTLAVTRFDRTGTGDGLRRLHQEDANQAMGLSPQAKYASAGPPSRKDPSLGRIAQILERHSTEPEEQLTRLLQQATVNVAVGNTDAHAKNYGLLHPTPGTVELSPLYDVAPTIIINPGMPQMGLRVNNILLLDRIRGSSLVDEAASWGLNRRTARSTTEEALLALQDGIASATERYPQPGERLAHFVKQRIDGLLASLT